MVSEGILIEPARAGDSAAIFSVLAANRADLGLFQKSPSQITASLGDFFVARDRAGQVCGCAGLHRDSPELAEIYAVAVLPACQREGIGRQLLQACQDHACSSGIRHLWLATVKPEYFALYGFQPISRWELPASVLLRKLRQILHQPVGRWLPVLFGRHTFMRCGVRSV
jgi:amino-acid N-acetyltransferase